MCKKVAMQVAQIQEELHQLIEEADPKLFKMLYTLAQEYNRQDALNSEQLGVLDKRLEVYEAG